MMKIGIVGPPERTLGWENHIQPHSFVSEVVLAGHLEDLGRIDACFILDDTPQKVQKVLTSIKLGYHTFLISKLPFRQALIEKVYHASEEANVRLQFSHWPTLAPASQWMAQKIKKPTFIQINRALDQNSFLSNHHSFETLWVDELAYCLKYIGGAVHHIDVNCSELGGKPYAIHLFLRFDSGATASLFISICASYNSHQRLISDHSLLLECSVPSQEVRIGKQHNGNHLFFEKKSFDPSLAAEQGATQFLKAIRLKKPTLYDGYDLLQLTQVLEQIKSRVR